LRESRLNADGVLLIDSRAHRTQVQNREAARERLVELLQEAAKRPEEAPADETDEGVEGEAPGVQDQAGPDQARAPTTAAARR
jgi:protein subunit release factor B